MTDSSIEVNHAADGVTIRVAGRATALVGPDVREFLHAILGRGVRHITLDLGQCSYMDSTFIGVLTLAVSESRGTAAQILIANAGPVPRGLLAGLGVDRLFAYVDSAPAAGPWEPLAKQVRQTGQTPAPGPQALGQTALAAHQALGTANPENVPRFRDVIECLRRETQQRST